MANYDDYEHQNMAYDPRKEEAAERAFERTGGVEGGRLSALHSRTPKVTVLKPKPPEPTLAEEIVATLEKLAADIKSGELVPSHLVVGWGQKSVIDGEAATHYEWDAIGINTYEVIGHLSVYVTRLAMGDGE